MIDLVLDSSDKDLLVGIFGDSIKDVVSYSCYQRQSELLVYEIDKLMDKHNLTRKDIASVCVSKGPGSYTGIRIALTVAKIIAFSLNIPLYVGSSLEILRNREAKSLIVSNARGKRSYVAIYDKDKEILKDCIKENVEVLSMLEKDPSLVLCGDAAYLGKEGYKADVASNLILLKDEAHYVKNPMEVRPLYLKDDYASPLFKIVVRKMLPSDLDEVMAIENECFKHPYDLKQMLYEMNENPVSYLYVALVDNKVVGFIDFYVTFNSSSICQIATKKEYRNKGVANMLLGQMIKDCESKEDPVEFITLEVRKSNEVAQKFYKKHKFEEITTKKSYYDDGEDALYFVRSIING